MQLTLRKKWALTVATVVLAASACSVGANADDDAAFWSALRSTASEVEQYGSVEEMAASADLVVLGSIESIGVGRTWGSEDPTDRLVSLVLQVKIDEVLKGEPIEGAGDVVSVEHAVTSFLPDTLRESLTDQGLKIDDSTFAEIPRGRAVWFLWLRRDLGTELAPGQVQYEGGQPYGLVSSMGVIAEGVDGSATTPVAVIGPSHDREPELPEERLVAEVTNARFQGVVDIASSP
jgi:hypothetical protein